MSLALVNCKNDKNKKEEDGEITKEDTMLFLLLLAASQKPPCSTNVGSKVTIPASGTYSVCGSSSGSTEVVFANPSVQYNVVATEGRASYSFSGCSSTSRTLPVSFSQTVGSTSTVLVSSSGTSNLDFTPNASNTYKIEGSSAPSLTCGGVRVSPSVTEYRITFTVK
ncbi:hypothetical protein [Leptospira idonii]|uniref:Uncharacterized protein n=1 Tax=Leptospira idonii TaxID=1193500 RepID=A0A4R9LXV1_9LEPT|nr:hypothetical protein [Leptospira idonii]TGN18147.1 hypothetical protein EHS15_12075 [Leptospira idonii]